MEIEAKFSIPDQYTLERLARAIRLGPFEPGPVSVRRTRDRYLDTAGRALRVAGYACRIRDDGRRRLITLKGLGGVEGAVHSRFETEVALPPEATTDPQTWPDSDGRRLALSLVKDTSLEELFVVEQERTVRTLARRKGVVAELCIDRGAVTSLGQRRPFSIVEVEITAGGTVEDLQTIVSHLVTTWKLIPEPRSKYDLGWEMIQPPASGGAPAQPGKLGLSPDELRQLHDISGTAGDEVLAKWARLVLACDGGASVNQARLDLGLSRSWAYEVVQRFRQERMGIFGDAAQPPVSSRAQRTATEGAAEIPKPLTSVAELCARFEVDMAHARWVADTALTLYDATTNLHNLPDQRRTLLEKLGLLHNVGLHTDPDRHHIAGRDIVMENPVEGLSQVEQSMMAAGVYLHRRRVTAKTLSKRAVASLPLDVRRDALVLAAIFRIADGLDVSGTQTTWLERVDVLPSHVHIVVMGEHAAQDAARAQEKSDLWQRILGVPCSVSSSPGQTEKKEPAAEVVMGQAPIAVLAETEPRRDSPGVCAGDEMWEAGCKVLQFHLQRMLDHEMGTRDGEDIEELHDMRVATRRMRAALRVFAAYYRPRAIRPVAAGLKGTARSLGTVRDLDVFIAKAQEYLSQLSDSRSSDLDPLFEKWEQERRQARDKMMAYLDSPRYAEFVIGFRAFLSAPGSSVRRGRGMPPEPTRVRHVAPQMIYARWAGVMAFGAVLEGAPVSVLHALRIECKRLRYTLEFFREALGEEATGVIEEVVLLQDHLGDLNDADVANRLLSEFLFPVDGPPEERVIAPGVVAYLAEKQRELQTLAQTFGQTWDHFTRAEVRQKLAAAVGAL